MMTEAMDRHVRHLGEVFPSMTVIEMAGGESRAGIFERTRAFLGNRYYGARRASGYWVAVAAGMATVSRTVLAIVHRRDLGKLWEELRYVAAPDQCPLTVMGVDETPLEGEDAGTEDMTIMSAIAGAEVYAPTDVEEARHILWHCVTRRGLCYVRTPESLEGVAPPGVGYSSRFTPGVWPILREGGHAVLIAYGPFVPAAMEAASALSAEGIDAAVWNASSIRPLDERKLAESVKRNRRLVVIEGRGAGGIGTLVASAVTDAGGGGVTRVGIAMRGATRPAAVEIAARVKGVLEHKYTGVFKGSRVQGFEGPGV